MHIDSTGKAIKHTLTLSGSPAALIAAMQAFDAAEGNQTITVAGNAVPTPSTSTGTGTPVAPATPLPSPSSAASIPTAPMPTGGTVEVDSTQDEEGDDTGPAGDGAGTDADGLPWDERIHSSNKQKSANGKWMKRRGGPKGAELAAIEAEIRSGGTGNGPPPPPMPTTAPAPMPTAAPVAPTPPMPTATAETAETDETPLYERMKAAAAAPAPMPTAGPTPMPAATAPMPQAAPAPMPVAEPPVTPATPASADPASLDFPSLMQHIGPKMGDGEGQISAAYLQQVCAHYGIAALTDLALKPELIASIVAQFQVDGRW